ncbi:peptide chain release factor 2 [Geminicoccus roseus]|uniref:peptide chain release factor 2 n=1 Tax=Geminicoccus roseus TaxID=404900 RepID=UPI0012FB1005|nr:peptide chain release factor 2 [Geminicoccus roseus]
MRAEIANLADELKEGVTLLRRHLDWDEALIRLDELNALSEDPTLWNDAERAQKIMRERNGLAARIDQVRDIETRLNDGVELAELAEAEDDEATIAEVQAELGTLRDTVRRLQLEALLSGEADRNNAFVELNAGAGGTESQDWAEMLMRMYTRWAEQHGYKVSLIQETEGEEAGIKSATLKLDGENAYGWLKTEAGVHRLVRISPYDSQARRHTSFASVWVYPEIDDSIEIDIQDKDLRIDTYRASGAGGQHVNRTESAIRITHMPTGIVVSCQSDRSQHRNRDTAFGMLRARLYELELQKRRAAADATEAAKTDIGWGHQIRSYVLQPYRMVKDLRTSVETSDTQGVLDGDLDQFLEASLARGVAGVATEVEDPA